MAKWCYSSAPKKNDLIGNALPALIDTYVINSARIVGHFGFARINDAVENIVCKIDIVSGQVSCGFVKHNQL
jgi:hypothetical protein